MFSEPDFYQNAWWTFCFLTDNRHSYGYQHFFVEKKLARPSNTFRYIDDVLSMNNAKFGNYISIT